MPPPNSYDEGPVCVLKQTSGQSIPSGADTKATWDTLLLDTAKMFSSGANTKITVPKAGWYKVGCAMTFAVANNSRRVFWTIYQNGVATELESVIGAANSAYLGQTFEGPLLAAANDYFEVDIYQDGVGASVALQNPCRFWAYRMPW